MANFVKNTVAKRLEGDRPSVVRALLVAVAVGMGAALLTYKLMRTQS
jgi:hypothetical protein